jgi:hypothetical protein
VNHLLTNCPVCAEPLAVRRLHCRNCDTTIDGQFDIGRLGRLTADQVAFVETFVRCEGKLNRMEREVGLSYPTLRARLTEVIRQMGFPVGAEPADSGDDDLHRLLDELTSGKITAEEAMRSLEAG